MTTENLSPPELRRAGIRALIDRLGLSGTVRFLQQFDAGYGDYTREREQWLSGLTVDDIVQDVEDTGQKQ